MSNADGILLPNSLWTDPRFALTRKKATRLRLLANVCRVMQACGNRYQMRLRQVVWLANLNVSARQLEAVLSEWEADDVLFVETSGDYMTLTFSEWVFSTATPTIETARPVRPRYESDDPEYRRKKRAVNGGVELTPQTTPPSPVAESERPLLWTPPNLSDSESDSESYKSESDLIPDLTESESDGLPAPPMRMADSTTLPERDLRQELMRVVQPAEKASSLLSEFGPERVRDVLDCIPFWPKPKKGGYGSMVVRALIEGPEKWPIPKGLREARERATQERMTLLEVRPGSRPDRPPKPAVPSEVLRQFDATLTEADHAAVEFAAHELLRTRSPAMYTKMLASEAANETLSTMVSSTLAAYRNEVLIARMAQQIQPTGTGG